MKEIQNSVMNMLLLFSPQKFTCLPCWCSS